MTTQAFGTTAADPDAGRPSTKYYFAYGSNLHLQQMKKRCPGSKLIGHATLWHYRWQINERGYANVVADEGHWVEGIVYEINARDEARLDVNEGVSKNAYQKGYMTVMLRRAEAALYRRPVSWIVNNGGPAPASQVAQQAGGQRRPINHEPHWERNVLVYISPDYTVDSKPKEEYVNRINLGLVDARVLGMAEDYISNCVRPVIPASPNKAQGKMTNPGGTATTTPPKPKVVRKVPTPGKKVQQPARQPRQPVQRRTGGPSPSRATQAPSHPPPQIPAQQVPSQAPPQPQAQHLNPRVILGLPRQARTQARSQASSCAPPLPPRSFERDHHHYSGNTLRPVHTDRRRAASDVGAPPPLPPRPARRMRSIPVIYVQEGYGGAWYR